MIKRILHENSVNLSGHNFESVHVLRQQVVLLRSPWTVGRDIWKVVLQSYFQASAGTRPETQPPPPSLPVTLFFLVTIYLHFEGC